MVKLSLFVFICNFESLPCTLPSQFLDLDYEINRVTRIALLLVINDALFFVHQIKDKNFAALLTLYKKPCLSTLTSLDEMFWEYSTWERSQF